MMLYRITKRADTSARRGSSDERAIRHRELHHWSKSLLTQANALDREMGILVTGPLFYEERIR